jgi:plasmid stability protein
MVATVEIPDIPGKCFRVLRARAAAEGLSVEAYARRPVLEEADRLKRLDEPIG